MFKPGCGRKAESEVWKHFVYDTASDKSRCIVKIENDVCGQTLVGKNATNLRNHLRSRHKALNVELEKKEAEQKKLKTIHADKQQPLLVSVSVLLFTYCNVNFHLILIESNGELVESAVSPHASRGELELASLRSAE